MLLENKAVFIARRTEDRFMPAPTPRVESFVLRFIGDVPEGDAPASRRAWHGVIVHVQSNEEKAFAHFAEAAAFIARYVPVDDLACPRADEALEPRQVNRNA